ncbi:MAG: hypothetical protein U5K71_10385 [Gracilimonas sp.]|nr:hypothetical protein [Gracilimonas sp.]
MAERLQEATGNKLELTMITNRGTKVWPNGHPETFCTDHWRCRFKSANGRTNQMEIIELLQNLTRYTIDTIKTENLYTFDTEPAFSLGQGE